jgi:hypothetical protein
VSVLKKHSTLLNKSQLPGVKTKKAAAMTGFIKDYNELTVTMLTTAKLLKKINNMKTEVKKKSDARKTGNKPITLKRRFWN